METEPHESKQAKGLKIGGEKISCYDGTFRKRTFLLSCKDFDSWLSKRFRKASESHQAPPTTLHSFEACSRGGS